MHCAPTLYRRDGLELARVGLDGQPEAVAYWANWTRVGAGFGLMVRTEAGGWTGPDGHANTRHEAEARLDRMAVNMNRYMGEA